MAGLQYKNVKHIAALKGNSAAILNSDCQVRRSIAPMPTKMHAVTVERRDRHRSRRVGGRTGTARMSRPNSPALPGYVARWSLRPQNSNHSRYSCRAKSAGFSLSGRRSSEVSAPL